MGEKAPEMVFGEDGEKEQRSGAAAPPQEQPPVVPPIEEFVEKPMPSPLPIILAGASTAQMVLLKKVKDMAAAGKPVPAGPVFERLLLGSAGVCAVGGVLSALGILKLGSRKSELGTPSASRFD